MFHLPDRFNSSYHRMQMHVTVDVLFVQCSVHHVTKILIQILDV